MPPQQQAATCPSKTQSDATPGTTLVAVGAGHLSGDDSVIAMLEKGGYKVKRVQ